MWRNPITAGFETRPLFSEIPGSVPWILLALLTLVLALPPENLQVPAPHVSPPRTVQVEARISAVGEDQKHRHLPFTIFVLSQNLSWKLESTEDLEGEETLLSPELIDAINQAPDVFCIGTASSEGPARAEERRAASRAGKLAQWVAAAVRNAGRTRIFTLNAGQYRGPPELASTQQRKAILLITGSHDSEVDLSEALTSGLHQQEEAYPAVYSLLHDYSRSGIWLKLR